jgi:tetratricopeptide (TPR) repeat protein
MMRSIFSQAALMLLLTGPLFAGDPPPPVSAAPSNTVANPAPPMGRFQVSEVIRSTNVPPDAERLKKYHLQLELGREQRSQRSIALATKTFTSLMENDSPVEIKRQALFELALVAQDGGQFVRAEQIFGQYLHTFPDDPSTPEVILRQGLIYRQMGVSSLAISKFYAVMSTALKLKLENVDYYRKIVLQAQTEIADTYYQEGKYDQATDFFDRLLRASNLELDQTQIHYKLIRSLSYTTNTTETVAQSQTFLNLYPNAIEVPEVRFFLSSSLKKLGRNNDAMKQVLLLLQSQEDNARKNPGVWSYWQQRAGNDIANQLYKEGDYVNALQIYTSLADLDKSPTWQIPVWYQTALVYEQLQQWPKAGGMYVKILDRRKELTGAAATPSLLSLLDMAQWRRNYIDWMQKAKASGQAFTLNQPTNSTVTDAP